MKTLVRQACKRGDIRPLDMETGLFLYERDGGRTPELLPAAALASAAVGMGHVCLPLDRAASLLSGKDQAAMPDLANRRRKLLATSVVGRPGEVAPLILDNRNRLYLYRFFLCEQRVAGWLTDKADILNHIDTATGRQLLARLFPADKDKNKKRINDQLIAAALSLLKPLLIISGGPGTGKTWTVARILALHQAMANGGKNGENQRLGLAAPTGKAAARLQQSLQQAAAAIDLDTTNMQQLQTKTLHRLLGYRPRVDGFRHNEQNPLRLDLLVVDEASMIDISLMDALLSALPPTCRLILLGDRHQLASVEAGSLFADLCSNRKNSWSPQLCRQLEDLTGCAPLPQTTSAAAGNDTVVTLGKSFRFDNASGIGMLATTVNSGDLEKVKHCLQSPFPDLEINYTTGNERRQWLRRQILRGYRKMITAQTIEEAFAALESFRILCAVRKGAAGVETINLWARQVLADEKLIPDDTDWFAGRPIIIRRNQYRMHLFNGDTGILRHDDAGRLKAWFMQADNRLHGFSPGSLPEHEDAWAITVHKAQGSEFDKVLLLLPEEESRVLSRELLYTGITRAKTQLILCGDKTRIATAVRRRTNRWSGLADRLQATE